MPSREGITTTTYLLNYLLIPDVRWQDVQGFDHKMMSRRRTLQRSRDELDGFDLDLHQLPVSNWPSLWQQRTPQKRPADCEETNDAKRQRTSRQASD